DLTDLDLKADLKCPISLVHEIASKRDLTIKFEVIRESGPPHMRTFVTVCVVEEYRTEGEGTRKKVSKKMAAKLMLEELRKLPALPPTMLVRKPTTKKKSRNLIKVGHEEQKAAPEYGHGIPPITRLIMIQKTKKEKEPVYTLLTAQAVPRGREFIMQVTVGTKSAQGSGPKPKFAKRAAAISMLQLLGYSRPQPQPGKPAIKTEGSHHTETDKTRKVSYLKDGVERCNVNGESGIVSNVNLAISNTVSGGGSAIGSGSSECPLVPGLFMIPDGSALHEYQQVQPQ
ncbi:unnamed protein product, partial [Meganyctiphanes norvegica]